MRRFGTGLALTTTLLYGCNAPESLPFPEEAATSVTTTHESPPTFSYEEQVTDLIQYYKDVTNFWMTQNVHLSDIPLEIIEGDEVVDCAEAISSSDLTSGYCHYLGSVLVTRAWIEYMNSDVFQPHTDSEVPRMAVFAAHELGHAAQYKIGDTRTSADYLVNPRRYELQADCYAGRALQAILPELTQVVQSSEFVYMPGSDAHGTTEERETNFVAGFNGDACRPR